jgi:hypothetical protein
MDQTEVKNRLRQHATGGKALRVHRFVWESVNGPVPDGMDVDHICRNRLCCNINHQVGQQKREQSEPRRR